MSAMLIERTEWTQLCFWSVRFGALDSYCCVLHKWLESHDFMLVSLLSKITPVRGPTACREIIRALMLRKAICTLPLPGRAYRLPWVMVLDFTQAKFCLNWPGCLAVRNWQSLHATIDRLNSTYCDNFLDPDLWNISARCHTCTAYLGPILWRTADVDVQCAAMTRAHPLVFELHIQF